MHHWIILRNAYYFFVRIGRRAYLRNEPLYVDTHTLAQHSMTMNEMGIGGV